MPNWKDLAAEFAANKTTTAATASLLVTLGDMVEEQKLAIIALEQRSSNSDARMDATHKLMRAEITRLRDSLECAQPRRTGGDRLPEAEYTAARVALGGGWHTKAAIFDMAARIREAKAPMQPVAQPDTEEVF